MVVSGAGPERAHRGVQPEETARQSPEALQSDALELYHLRHSCLTRWTKYIDPFTLHKVAAKT